MLNLLLLVFLSTTSVQGAGTETLIGVVGRDFIMLGADQSVARSIVLTSTEVDKIRVINDHVVMAGAGEIADVDDLFWNLKRQADERELEAGIPANVEYIYLNDDKSSGDVPKKPWTLLSVSAMAKLARNIIAQRLRSRAPYQQIGLLMAGMQQEQPLTKKLFLKSGITTSAFFAEDVRRQLNVASSSTTASEQDTSSSAASEKEEDNANNNNDNLLRPCLFWLDEYGSLQKVDYGIIGMSSNFGLAVLDQGFRENLTRQEAADLIRNCFDQLQTRFLINYSPKPPLIKCVDAKGCQIYNNNNKNKKDE